VTRMKVMGPDERLIIDQVVEVLVCLSLVLMAANLESMNSLSGPQLGDKPTGPS